MIDARAARRWLRAHPRRAAGAALIAAVAGATTIVATSSGANPPAAADSSPTSAALTTVAPISTTTTGPSPTTTVVIAAPPVPEPPPTTVEEPGEPQVAPPPLDPVIPPVVARTIPADAPPPLVLVSPWERSTTTLGSYRATDVGCARGTDTASLDRFFAGRVGPMIGGDYQHVYPLGGGRFLWLLQDVFLDFSGLAERLDQAAFVHNAALVQDGACFRLLQRGTISRPLSFEPGDGEDPQNRWFWPLGGELTADGMQVFWAEMVADAEEPGPGDGLGWHPQRTWLATYDPATLAQRSFVPATNDGVSPIYGYAVASDEAYTYLFGNTFEQNLLREGGYYARRHSATAMYLARVPRGALGAAPEYRTAGDWSADPAAAAPISERYWAENPMQPRYLDGVWVSATKVDGYWGEQLAIDVATQPWGPWTNVATTPLNPRGADPLMNTYHAHLLPWRDGYGNLVVAVSQNARDMVRDAFGTPSRYRMQIFGSAWAVAPEPPPDTVPDPAGAETTAPAPPNPPPSTTATPAPGTTIPPATTAPSTPTTAPFEPATTTTTTTTISPTTVELAPPPIPRATTPPPTATPAAAATTTPGDSPTTSTPHPMQSTLESPTSAPPT